jgi:ADP-ribose pyrophosphatase YjhB (NUDIX family)
MNFCPRCGTELGLKFDGGRDRPACPKERCGFIHFGYYSIGCGGVVIRDNRALLIQRGINPNRGDWQIPGGYVETDEEILSAVEREVWEESGVVTKASDVIGVRHTVGTPVANVYMVFRLDFVSGEPHVDGVETLDAGFFSLEEIEHMDRVQGFSKWSIKKALETLPGQGFSREGGDPNIDRPGWTLFGASIGPTT